MLALQLWCQAVHQLYPAAVKALGSTWLVDASE